MEQERLQRYASMLIEVISQTARLPDDRQSLGYGKGQRMILFYLDHHPNGVPSGELSQELHVGTGRIGNALKELERKGYIFRKTDEKDRRKVLVYPTQKGRDYASDRRKEFHAIIENAVKAVGEERFESFLKTYLDIVHAQNEAFGKERLCSDSIPD